MGVCNMIFYTFKYFRIFQKFKKRKKPGNNLPNSPGAYHWMLELKLIFKIFFSSIMGISLLLL